MSQSEEHAAAQEWNQLWHLGPAPNYFGKIVLQWAQAHPEDLRAPEALALVVRATRYGCTNKETGHFSRQAFNLLHRSYATSEWARKTPNWYQ